MPFTSPANHQAVLQLRYNELLEKRVAQLESAIETSARPSSQISEESNNKKVPPTTDPRKPREVEEETSNGRLKQTDSSKIPDEAKQGDGDAAKASKSRYRNVVRQFNKDTGVHEDIDVGGLDPKRDDDGEVAFVFRKTLPNDFRKNETYSEIDVEAPGLRALLRDCVGADYPGQNLDGDTVNLVTPFAPLIHNWEVLQEATKLRTDDDERTIQARQDLEKLLECVTTAPELEKYFKTRESNLKAHITTYETMWTIFPPKTKIVAKLFLTQVQLLEVRSAPIPHRYPMPPSMKLLAWCWDWNGKEMVKVYFFLSIDRFWGTKDINQLFCYPLQYHKDESPDDLCRMLRERGSLYNKIVRSKPGATQMYLYNGVALAERRNVIKPKRDTIRMSNKDNDDSSDDEDVSSVRAQTRRRKIVPVGVSQKAVTTSAKASTGERRFESQLLGENEPVWTGDLDSVTSDTVNPEETSKKDPSEDQSLLYPPRVLGYSTEEKIWGQFAIYQTQSAPQKNASLFQDDLELDQNYKNMIQALVEEHGERVDSKDPNTSSVKVKDVVENKGKGLVLLLHGPPGVGKTLTAETIAKATGKPLFVVSVAEIGLDASKAERNLDQMFYLAGKWEAVLLVDEADVFLEARTTGSDPNRNALVSVLLRVLEYYDGIMILTTNRITSLDIAVQSRIHLAIRYDDLTRQQKQNIFQLFLKQLKPDSISDFESIMEYIKEYGSDYKLNGRQIRNVVSSALSLARSQAKGNGGDERMTVKHLKSVLMITKDFQEQLESITMDQRSANEATRPRK
ncbi:26S protease regulatory subunit, putative [Talaromyces stipitatus ATCC 10500]|uniref:26S protease regulatory subunit, putative n=1 Tax=Talaromyces stipitatus (strain ATCC 10500 / CBS 375.48 / QM 6759 / NRRL 1006) TaxID=441959 RepID=B8M456_TALSN|nr:26S protease regulatory subunit, putative [Talaromyces stipitatus ATCC 10500]EED20799.1 26S protease regulatory subunit, putative [Talaromyces stipitatus ATCC 10500]